jgi:hypothetical protein
MALRPMKFPLVIIHYLNIDWPARTLGPLEADTPLIIDANAELRLSVSFKGFQPVTR